MSIKRHTLPFMHLKCFINHLNLIEKRLKYMKALGMEFNRSLQLQRVATVSYLNKSGTMQLVGNMQKFNTILAGLAFQTNCQ